MSFDHDLGDTVRTGYDVAKWIENKNQVQGGCYIPEDFVLWVHSQNPVGARKIHETMSAAISFSETYRNALPSTK